MLFEILAFLIIDKFLQTKRLQNYGKLLDRIVSTLIMPEYVPPPASLDHLNPIQRYLQKGKLEFQDYMNLVLLVLAYFVLRPYIEAGMKRIFENKDLKEGEQAQRDYIESKTKPKVSANEIRGAKTTAIEPTPGATGADVVVFNAPVSRRTKPTDDKPIDEVPPPTAEQLLEWSDIVTTGSTEGGEADVATWVNNWE